MDLGLTNRACLITGASRGLGLATAVTLAAEGACVFLTARDGSALAAAAERCRAAGAPAVATLALDVTGAEAGAMLVGACRKELGSLDVLVNNAGASALIALDDLTDEDWHAQWELHVMAPMRLMRAAAPGMAERGWGRIVNVTSSSGKRPSATNAAYSVSKSAQLALSRSYADAYAARGVLVNAVAPGPMAGSMWLDPGGLADQVAASRGTTREAALEQAAAKLPRGRLGTEEEVATVIAFLCSDAAANVAGAAWSVDGGAVPSIL